MTTMLVISSVLLWILVLGNMALVIALARRLRQVSLETGKQHVQMNPGQAAPDFDLPLLGGGRLRRSDLLGAPSAFLVVSPSCIGCAEAPVFLAQQEAAARERGLQLVLVSTAPADETRAYMEGVDAGYPVALAPVREASFYRDYLVPGTPFFYFVDGDGSVLRGNFFADELFLRDWRDLERRGALRAPERAELRAAQSAA